MTLPYKIRLSLQLTGTSALVVLGAFLIIYKVAEWTLIRNIDKDLTRESRVHEEQITLRDGVLAFSHSGEWEEEEHQEVQFHPIFIEIVDAAGRQIDRSPNLGNLRLSFRIDQTKTDVAYFEFLGGQELRQLQTTLRDGDKIEGYLLVATSFEESRNLLDNLRTILFVLYPLILLSLFLAMRFLAGKSIEPVDKITKRAKLISQNNLNERIPLPVKNDEIKALAVAINGLLERLEDAMNRERQFTSDASHELRTPISILKGNFEVLIRKPREQAEYVSKIKSGLAEIEKLDGIIDQLLDLARFQREKWDIHEIEIGSIAAEVAEFVSKSNGRQITVDCQSEEPIYVNSNEKSLFIILNNLIRNAVKFSQPDTPVLVEIWKQQSSVVLEVKDKGIGMEEQSLSHVFSPFFRENSTELGKVPGSGLGLSIVKKLCDHLGIAISLSSLKGKGTTVRLVFEQHTES
jgi:signal transduction histidine kinase